MMSEVIADGFWGKSGRRVDLVITIIFPDGEISGHLFNLYRLLSASLNLTHVFVESVDNRFGSLTDDGVSFDGLVGMVQRGEIDFIMADLSFSGLRRQVVDSLHPIYYYKHT